VTAELKFVENVETECRSWNIFQTSSVVIHVTLLGFLGWGCETSG
jgi:hypothetical protein